MKESIISRTIISNIARGLYFDMEQRKACAFECVIPAAYNDADKAEKFLRKNPAYVPGKIITVESVNKSEKLVGMKLSTFVENAKPADERSKETRDCVSKTVISGVADALYMDANRQIQTTVVFFPANTANVEAFIRKNVKFSGHFITVENVRTCEQLYYMSEVSFIELAKPMKNKFTLAE